MSASDALNFWNKRFDDAEYIFGTEPNAFLKSQKFRLKTGAKALAVADGEGRNGVWMAGLGLDVLSVDFSPVALQKAQALATKNGVPLRTECVDLSSWNWGAEKYDVVVAIFIQFASPALRQKIFQRMKDVLLPGGLLLLEGYRPEQISYNTGGPSDVENLYTRSLLEDAFSDMKILHLSEYDADVSEGTRHSGMSALIDLVAQT